MVIVMKVWTRQLIFSVVGSPLLFMAGLHAPAMAQTGAVAGPETVALAEQTDLDADLKVIKSRLLESQRVEGADALKALADNAMALSASLGADGKWADVNYADTSATDWSPSRHVENIVSMARAYATPGQPLYHQEALLQKINLGLDSFFAGNYLSSNWWFNDIGVPLKMGTILLLLDGTLSPQRKDQGLANLKRSADDKSMRKATGANLSWLARIQLMRGLAQPSSAIVADSFDAMWSEIEIAGPGGEGIQADYSFHQHGPLPYNGGYAGSFLNYATDFYSYARGTHFALPEAKERIVVNFLIDGQDWMSLGSRFDPSVQGRNITRMPAPNDTGATGPGWRQIAARWAEGTTWRHDELLAVAHRSDETGQKRVGNRHFWDSDFMVHHRPGYYASVRMHSTRTRNTDGASKGGGPINGEGRLSHHMADGATYILRRGDEYQSIFPVWNWKLIPGTTAQQVAALDETHVAFKGASRFVGGVTDGLYGAAAMTLERDGLRAQKAWFYFDAEFVALGSGITDTSGTDVRTAVNQSLLHGDVRVANRAAPVTRGEHHETGVRWVWHDDTGYIFPADAPLRLSNQTQTGRWSDIGAGPETPVSLDVFNLSLDHGSKPQNASYEYIVVPNATVAALNERVAHPAVETLSNTPELQAVRHNTLKILEAVFRRPGTVSGGVGWNLSVDVPCLVLLREVPNGLEIAVSNPENQPLAVNLELDRKLVGEGASAQGNRTRIHLDLPEGLNAGSSVVRVFEK